MTLKCLVSAVSTNFKHSSTSITLTNPHIKSLFISTLNDLIQNVCSSTTTKKITRHIKGKKKQSEWTKKVLEQDSDTTHVSVMVLQKTEPTGQETVTTRILGWLKS